MEIGEEYDSARTGSVLMDIADWRKDEEERIRARGIKGNTQVKLLDGLDPERKADAYLATLQTVLNPSWSNTLTAAALTVISAGDKAFLRKALIQLGALAVAWIEVLDQRPDDSEENNG